MRNTLPGPAHKLISARILLAVCFVHGIAIAGIINTQSGASVQAPSTLIQATLLPGLPSISPAPEVEQPTQKPESKPKVAQKEKPKPVAKPIAAPVSAEPSETTAQTVASPAAETEDSNDSEVSNAGGGSQGNDAPITEAHSNYLSNPAPAYPALSRRMGEQGRVKFRVLVDRDGTVKELELFQSSGFKRLDQAAQDAIRNWKFTPARRGEEQIAAWVIVPFEFNLKG